MPSNTSQLSRIEALAFCFDNAATLDMEEAATNAANGCPAFWHRATKGNDVVGGFLFYLAKTQDVIRAWQLFEHEFRRPSRMREERFLDELLPLNPQAASSLADAYQAIGTFRSEAELIGRTDKAEDEALDALRALRAKGSKVSLVPLDWSRVDEAARAINREALSAPVVAAAVNLAKVA